MRYFLSPYFYLAVAVGAGAFQVAIGRTKLPPNVILAIISCGFILTFFDLDRAAILCVGLALGVNFAAARLFKGKRAQAAPRLGLALLWGTVAFDLLLLGLAKYFVIQSAEPGRAFGLRFSVGNESVYPLRIIGISYFTFKLIHFVVDAHSKSDRKVPFWTYFSFMLFFPTFVSGPIDRFDRFSADVDTLRGFRFDAAVFNVALYRIASGLCRKFAATALMQYTIGAMPPAVFATAPLATIIVGVYLFTAVLYLDFSGYTDLAIGIAYVFGIKTPENFDNPFRALSIQEYWMRWHITLSLWIKDYVYFPLLKFLYTTRLSTWSALLPVIAFCVAFTLCGLWHGGSLSFVVWGALNGLGLGVYSFYSGLMRKRTVKRLYNKLSATPVWIGLSWLTTMTFVALVNVFFALDWDGALAVFGRLLGMTAG